MTKSIKSIMTFAFLPLLLSVCHTNAQTVQSFSSKDFKSCWQLKDMVYESGGSYSTEAVQRLTGTLICFNKDTLNILGDTIIHAKYSIAKESTKAFTVREFQVFEDIPKWFKITTDSLYTIKLHGVLNKTSHEFKIHQISTDRDLAYDGKYLYLSLNGALFRLTKYHKKSMRRYVGSGSTIKEFTLSGKEKSLNLFYEFYTDPDEIIVYDQNGKELYHSEIVSTKQEKSVNIKLDNTTKLTVKIISKTTDSRWAFRFDAK